MSRAWVTVGEMVTSLPTFALGALAVSLVVGATPLELVNGFACAVALGVVARDRRVAFEWFAPTLAVVLGLVAFVDHPRFDAFATLREAWAWSTALAVPVLAAEPGAERAVRPGLIAAAVAGLVAAGQGAWGLAHGGWGEPSALFSHHLSLGYALGPALIVATVRRDWLAVPIAVGVLASAGAGPAVAAFAAVAVGVVVPVTSRPRAVAGGLLVGAVALGLAAMRLPYLSEEVGRRAVLWTAGADLAVHGGVPAGSWRSEVAPVHRGLDASFEFPQHAHDDAIQRLAEAGPFAWTALAAAVALAFESGAVVPMALVVWLVVGGLTQDLLGDIEVLRAAILWAGLGTVALAKGREDV